MSKHNRILTKFGSGVLVLILLIGTPAFAQDLQPDQSQASKAQRASKTADDTRLHMRAKLANSKKVMEGLVTENFQMIRDGAIQMKEISETAHWPTTIDEVYQHFSVDFRMQCDKLAKQAFEGDLQAAHYTHLGMSTTCIECHSYVRRKFTVQRLIPGGPVQLIPTQWDGPLRKKKLPVPEPDDDGKVTKRIWPS